MGGRDQERRDQGERIARSDCGKDWRAAGAIWAHDLQFFDQRRTAADAAVGASLEGRRGHHPR
jgi:hypothetical protein